MPLKEKTLLLMLAVPMAGSRRPSNVLLDFGSPFVVANTSDRSHGFIRPAPAAAVFSCPPRGAMARRGKRKDSLREKNGRLQRNHEEIIPEGIAMRRMAVLDGGYSRDRHGELMLTGAVRDMRAESPLGVCRARVLILEIEFQAGERYERQHRRHALRARTPQTCIGNLQPSGEGSIAIPTDAHDNAVAENAYLASREGLQRAGSRAFHLVTNLVIHHHWPRFLDTLRDRPAAAWLADARDVAALRAGLEALARVEPRLRGEKGDDFAALIEGLERKYERRPTECEIAWGLLHFSVTSFALRREQRLKRETAR